MCMKYPRKNRHDKFGGLDSELSGILYLLHLDRVMIQIGNGEREEDRSEVE